MAAFFKPDQRRRGAGRGRRASSDALADEPDVASAARPWSGEEVGTIIGEDLARAEMLAFPIIFLLSLWVFRGVIAALLPLADGRPGDLRRRSSAIGLFNEAMTLSVYALNLASA